MNISNSKSNFRDSLPYFSVSNALKGPKPRREVKLVVKPTPKKKDYQFSKTPSNGIGVSY